MTIKAERGVASYRTLIVVLLAIVGSSMPTVAAGPTRPGPAPMLEVQVLLDRAHFSPGEIDGKGGPNTDRALTAFAKSRRLEIHDRARLLEQLGSPGADTIITYTLTPADVAGPFETIPEDMMEKSKLPRLGFQSSLEQLGEQFHCSVALLRELNPSAAFAEGEAIRVPNVASEPPSPVPNLIVTVSKQASVLTVTDADGRTVFHAPVTTGSEHDPLPIGPWQVTAIVKHPTFNYNPDLFWDAEPSHAKAKIPPGPNSPVGVVWIDISKPHYGIHGTPEPQSVGHTASHGCVRLTNWDALTLAGLVAKGTQVLFSE